MPAFLAHPWEKIENKLNRLLKGDVFAQVCQKKMTSWSRWMALPYFFRLMLLPSRIMMLSAPVKALANCSIFRRSVSEIRLVLLNLRCCMEKALVRILIYVVQVYGIRTRDKVVKTGNGDIILFH